MILVNALAEKEMDAQPMGVFFRSRKAILILTILFNLGKILS